MNREGFQRCRGRVGDGGTTVLVGDRRSDDGEVGNTIFVDGPEEEFDRVEIGEGLAILNDDLNVGKGADF